MKKDLRKDQDWRVRAHLTPTSGLLPRRECWAERLARSGPAPRAGWGRAGGGAALAAPGTERPA